MPGAIIWVAGGSGWTGTCWPCPTGILGSCSPILPFRTTTSSNWVGMRYFIIIAAATRLKLTLVWPPGRNIKLSLVHTACWAQDLHVPERRCLKPDATLSQNWRETGTKYVMAVRDTTTFLFPLLPSHWLQLFVPPALPCILATVTEEWESKMSEAGQVGGTLRNWPEWAATNEL